MMEQRVVVVLGMHHSGTSVVARSLAILNVYLGDDLMAVQPDHPGGFWEDNKIMAANDCVLKLQGFSWRKPGFDCARMKRNPWYGATIRAITQDLRARFGHAPLWGFKDPRTCRLVPLWEDVFKKLGVKAHYIVVVRHPRSVAESLRAKYGMSLRTGYTLWLEHVMAAVDATRNARRVFVSYDRMLDDPRRELRREAIFLGLNFGILKSPQAELFRKYFLNFELRHTRYHTREALPGVKHPELYHDAMALLEAAAADKISETAFRRGWSAYVHK